MNAHQRRKARRVMRGIVRDSGHRVLNLTITTETGEVIRLGPGRIRNDVITFDLDAPMAVGTTIRATLQSVARGQK